jgi:DNA-binding transcriptional regulator YbjK
MPVAVESRGAVRRKAIIEAALRLIGRKGREGLTHRAVAKEAGVPLGATTYYFESRGDLLAQTLEYVAEGELERFKSEREQLAKVKTPPALAKFVTERLVDAATDRDALIAEGELWLEAGREPELRKTAWRWCDSEQRLFARVLERLGSREPGKDASIIVAVLDGYGERVLARSDPAAAARKLRPELTRLIERLLARS